MKRFFIYLILAPLFLASGCGDADKEISGDREISFTYDAGSLYTGWEIAFTSVVDGGSSATCTYDWSFGDGSESSTVQNPVHTYKNTGYYTVRLRVNDGKLNYSYARNIYIDAFSGIAYESLVGLSMAGYQGWFNTPDDGAGLGWKHYRNNGLFEYGYCAIDLWPDVSEYEVTYPTPFLLDDQSPAHVFSSYDATTTDTHFRWMREYGIDGIFLQRFVTALRSSAPLANENHILLNCMGAAEKYNRAFCVMYDLSGMQPGEETTILIEDWKNLAGQYRITSQTDNHYLHHNGKPLVAIWGVGFSGADRAYGLTEAETIIDFLLDEGCSIMLGLPAQWRTLNGDAVSDAKLHDLIKKCDVVLPWFVGRYNFSSYASYKPRIAQDIAWCQVNGVDYIPTLFPGFSWYNLKNGADNMNSIPRRDGDFFWAQAHGAVESGARSLYLAMFDEMDEGTAFFKCTNNPPVSGTGESGFTTKFLTYEGNPSDHYLWLAGQARRMLRGAIPPTATRPVRE